ncbi:MAG: Spy/CpxP family protein refolding chaperone [Deltaproteobacteria bacterium]|nr:Spy/CpxP family protein refolding chaperone [Deltaproteobacteria bacterium]
MNNLANLSGMKWRSGLIVTVAAVAMLAWIPSVDARGRGRGRGMGYGQGYGQGQGRAGYGMGNGYGLIGLNLTAEQQQRVSVIRADSVKAAADANAKLNVKRAELQVLWSAKEPNAKAIKAKHAEMDILRVRLRQIRVDRQLAVQAILTPEQRAVFQGCPGPGNGYGRRGGRGQGRGMGRGMGGGGGGGRGMGGGGW